MKYDIIVVGSGPGGYVAAIRAAQSGKRTAVIEKAELGGVCLNWGCIPTKALMKSAQVYKYVSHASDYGLVLDGVVAPDMDKIVDRSRSVAETMSKGVAFLLKKNNVDVIQGYAKLSGAGRLNVTSTCEETAGEVSRYEAEHIILATGARPRELPFIPVDGDKVINSRHALTLRRIPESLAVIGSGAIGSEFAYLFASFGSKVTVIEYMPNMLPLEDEDVSKYMERSFRKLKATVMTGTTVKSVCVDPETGLCKTLTEGPKGEKTVETEMVLSAVGIKSNIEGLGLEELGVETDRDKIIVDEFYRTSVKGIYAIGDIVGGPALAHVASSEALCCVEKICGGEPTPVDYTTIPSCVYTSPEVASVGMTEKEAIDQGISVRAGTFPFTASGKATSAGNRDGFVKLVFDSSTDELIGAHMVGDNVTEMIAEPTIAKALGATAKDIINTIHPHPTMSEAVLEAAEASHGKAVHI